MSSTEKDEKDLNIKGTEKQGMGFKNLVGLFEQTQSAMQTQAARSVDIALVVRNWLFGWYIVEFENGGAEREELYGKKLLQRLSAELKQSGLKGVSHTNLKQFSLFYVTYKEIGQALPDQSSICTINKAFSTHDLETALIDKIEHFLLELGKGFLFESRQKRFSFDNRHFYVDLVFYNPLLRSYTIIDLKIGNLKHQDLGQRQMYVNYFDRFVKLDEENPTVGILLCLSKSDELVELTLPKDTNIYASEYQLYLPSKEELKKQLEDAQQDWEAHHEK